MNELFSKIARRTAQAMGSPIAFVAAVTFVMVWAMTGPVFGYSSTWQLVINTATTIITFLMVFIIQNAQNRDERALQLKLDELLRATKSAKTGFVSLEDLDDVTLDRLQAQFREMHDRHAKDTD